VLSCVVFSVLNCVECVGVGPRELCWVESVELCSACWGCSERAVLVECCCVECVE